MIAILFPQRDMVFTQMDSALYILKVTTFYTLFAVFVYSNSQKNEIRSVGPVPSVIRVTWVLFINRYFMVLVIPELVDIILIICHNTPYNDFFIRNYNCELPTNHTPVTVQTENVAPIPIAMLKQVDSIPFNDSTSLKTVSNVMPPKSEITREHYINLIKNTNKYTP